MLSLEEENVTAVGVEDGVGLCCGMGWVGAALWFQETSESDDFSVPF